jgi:hypothetical protein
MITRYVSRVLFVALLGISFYDLFGSKQTHKRVRSDDVCLEIEKNDEIIIKKKKTSQQEYKNLAIFLDRDTKHASLLLDAISAEIASSFEKNNACVLVDVTSLSMFIKKVWHLDAFVKNLSSYSPIKDYNTKTFFEEFMKEHGFIPGLGDDHDFYVSIRRNDYFLRNRSAFFKKEWDVYHIKGTIFFICVPALYKDIKERFKRAKTLSSLLDHNDNKNVKEAKKLFEEKIMNINLEKKQLSRDVALAMTCFMNACTCDDMVHEEWNVVLEGHGCAGLVANLTPEELQGFLDVVNTYNIKRQWRTHMLFVASCFIGGPNQKFFHSVFNMEGKVTAIKTWTFPIFVRNCDDTICSFIFLKDKKCPDFFKQAEKIDEKNKQKVEDFLMYCSSIDCKHEFPLLKSHLYHLHGRPSFPMVSFSGESRFSIYPLKNRLCTIDKKDDNNQEELYICDVNVFFFAQKEIKRPLRIGFNLVVASYPAFVLQYDCDNSHNAFYCEKITIEGEDKDSKKLGDLICFIRDSFGDIQGSSVSKTILIKDLACGTTALLDLLKDFKCDVLKKSLQSKENITLHNVIVKMEINKKVERIIFECEGIVCSCHKEGSNKWKCSGICSTSNLGKYVLLLAKEEELDKAKDFEGLFTLMKKRLCCETSGFFDFFQNSVSLVSSYTKNCIIQ